MNAMPLLRSYGITLAISGAGLALFWILSEAETRPVPPLFARAILLFATAGVTSLLIHRLGRPPALRDVARGVCNGRRGGVDEPSQVREPMLNQLIDALPAQVWTTRPDGSAQYLNKKWLDYTGLSLDEAKGSGWAVAVHPDDRPVLLEVWNGLLGSGRPGEVEARMRGSDGDYRWFLFRAQPVRDAAGEVTLWLGTNTDIDDLKKADEILRRSERDLRLFIDAMPAMAWRMTPQGEPSYLNKQLQERFKLEIDDLGSSGRMASAISKIVHPDDRERIADRIASSLRTGEPGQMVYRRKFADGEYRWMEARLNPVRDENGSIVEWFGVTVDIDDLKTVEQELRNAEQELRTMLETLPALAVSSAPDGTIDFVSAKSLGAGLANELRRKGRLSIVHPDDRQRSKDIYERALRGGESYEVEERLEVGEGDYRWFLTRCVAVKDEAGTVTKRYAIATDIDDLKRSEAELRTKERELQGLIDTIPSLVWCVLPNGEPEYVNKRLEEYYGRGIDSSQSVEGSNLKWSLEVLMHPDDIPEITSKLTHSLTTGEPFSHRYRNRRYDGAYRWVDSRAEPLRDENGKIVRWYGVCVDVDDEIKTHEGLLAAQQQLARASQLASLAELSASIAHEVSQPLSAIITHSHACQRWLAADPPNLDRAKTIAERLVRDANAAADIVARIRALFRHAAGEKTLVAVNELIHEACSLTGIEMAKSHVALELSLCDALPPILADRVQIQQVLINLIRNGVDAMRSTEGPRSISVCSRRADDEAIVVEVRDSGVGLSQPERIFEPFFTTKKEGMGMGLAICRSIIENHEGTLWATGAEPRGAVFSFTLPIVPVADAA